MIKISSLVLVAIFLSSINAYADVRNEIGFGSSMSVEENGYYGDDINGFTTGFSYTYFFKPIKESGRTIELRQFHQHPSRISVSTEIQYYEADGSDYSVDSDAYDLNAEIFIPSHTGFLIGLSKADYRSDYGDYEILTTTVGVKQYIADMIELSLKYDQYEEKGETYYGHYDRDGDLMTYKAHLTFSDKAGFFLEKGRGKNCSSCSKYDEDLIELQLYGGRSFVFRLGRMENDYEWTKTYIAPKFWFGEKFSMELNLFNEEFYDGDGYGLALNCQIRF